MAELAVSVVSLEHPEWEGAASQIVLKTVEGEMGILPGHEPVLATLVDAPIRIDPVEGDPLYFAVHGGFFSLDEDRVIVLADIAESFGEIDLARAQDAKQRAEAAIRADEEDIEAMESLQRATTRIRIIEEYS
ncbi:MAG: F0F1 ATP synthase subunit epsilon [Actinomycetia bacterium]|nr:F0F1 ATP synthase subunit epsilon [Actinomycetes bacterium]MCH9800787.1 F0F1 ATP synthase subunit epsilon [Actinomycetes bacterium]